MTRYKQSRAISERNRVWAVIDRDPRYLGQPCRNGHRGVRFTSTSHCCNCLYATRQKWRYKNRDTVAKYDRHQRAVLANTMAVIMGHNLDEIYRRLRYPD